MAQADLGKVRLTDAELSEKIIQVNGGVKLGKDADGKPGYVVTDAETGADTVIPFSSGGSSGGLPVSGSICFAGTKIMCYGESTAKNFISILDGPINISEINNIKILLSIQWYRLSSSSTTGINRQIFCYFYVQNSSGEIKFIKGLNVLSNTDTSAITLLDEEYIVPLTGGILSYEKLIGIGLQFYQYPGSYSSYYFNSGIGYDYSINTGKMEYIIR